MLHTDWTLHIVYNSIWKWDKGTMPKGLPLSQSQLYNKVKKMRKKYIRISKSKYKNLKKYASSYKTLISKKEKNKKYQEYIKKHPVKGAFLEIGNKGKKISKRYRCWRRKKT